MLILFIFWLLGGVFSFLYWKYDNDYQPLDPFAAGFLIFFSWPGFLFQVFITVVEKLWPKK
jgi:hypothetical protein